MLEQKKNITVGPGRRRRRIIRSLWSVLWKSENALAGARLALKCAIRAICDTRDRGVGDRSVKWQGR
jgi:hypothetical protein